MAMTAPLVIAVAGGSGSGKSTLCAAVLKTLPEGAAVLVSEDWYYKDVSAAPGFDPARFDFDDLAIRDHELLIAQLQELRRGRSVEAPCYAFERHAREPFTRPITPAPVILVEGCHLLCNAELLSLFDLKVYLEAPPDVRLIRRILRDQAERGRSLHAILAQYLRTVRPGHERLVAPSRDRADLVLEDQEAGVGETGAQSALRLAAPLLAHPRLKERLEAVERAPSGKEPG
jgi:uridine kinase